MKPRSIKLKSIDRITRLQYRLAELVHKYQQRQSLRRKYTLKEKILNLEREILIEKEQTI